MKLPALITLLTLAMAAGADAATLEGYVFSVADGNTVTISNERGGKADLTVRLYGITAPTLRQPCGPEAHAFLSKSLPKGAPVIVETVGAPQGEHAYALIQVRGTSVNYLMVNEGLAWVDRRHCRGVFCRRWMLEERGARESRKGVWALNITTPPWQWGEIR